MAKEEFKFISCEEKFDSEQTRRSLTYWQDVWRRLRKNKLSMAGLFGVIFIIIFGIIGPFFTPYSYSDQTLAYSNLSPRFDLYEIEDGFYINVTKVYRMLEISEDGHILSRIDDVFEDVVNKIYYYQQDFDVTLENAEAGTYPLTATIDAAAFYSEKWGIALIPGDYPGGQDTVMVEYIHPDSPFNGIVYEGEPFTLGDEYTLGEIEFVDDPNAAVPVYTKVGFTLGAEEVINQLEANNYIHSLQFGGDIIAVNFWYKLQDPENLPEGYEDVTITVTYRGVEQKYPERTVWNKTYLWGTDGLGRDVLTRVMFGARISLMVALIATFVNFFIGIFYGSIAGYAGGRVDNIMMRIVDIINSIPLVLYVILLMVVLREVIIDVNLFGKNYILFRGGSGLGTIILALGSVYWVQMARLVRGQILGLKEQEFVLAARTIGVSNRKIVTRHLIPNAMGPIIVSMTMMIPAAVFTEAFLSFIGLGVSAPQASWGTLANDALGGLTTYPYQLFFPAAAIAVTMLAFNFLGDGLRDALDPRLRKG